MPTANGTAAANGQKSAQQKGQAKPQPKTGGARSDGTKPSGSGLNAPRSGYHPRPAPHYYSNPETCLLSLHSAAIRLPAPVQVDQVPQTLPLVTERISAARGARSLLQEHHGLDLQSSRGAQSQAQASPSLAA